METLTGLLDSWIAFAGEHAAVMFGISIATLIMTFILLPIMITRLPQNYFLEDDRPRPLSRFVLVHWVLMALKNLLGFAFVLLGVMLLFLPGQGLLTLVIGLTIMNYPGKFAIERWLAMRPRVLPALNWLRSRYGKPPLRDP